jgi:hypothetical protein
MRHAISRTIDALGIVVAMSAIGLWVRSYHAVDRFGWSVEPGGGLNRLIVARSLETTPGRIVLRTHTAFS